MSGRSRLSNASTDPVAPLSEAVACPAASDMVGLDRAPSARTRALTRRELVVTMIFALVVGALAARNMVIGKLHNLPRVLETSESVLDGTPRWRAFQNRLPASALEYAWSRSLSAVAGIPRKAGFASYLALWAIALTFVHVLIGRHQLDGLGRGVTYASGAMLAVLLLQDDAFLYPWDLPEAVVFALFFLGIVTCRPPAAFVALYVLAVTMKETAVFMAAWLALQSFDLRRLLPGRAAAGDLRPTNGARLAVAVIGILLPMIYAKLVRDTWFVAQLGGTAEAALHRALGNHVWLVENLRAIVTCGVCGSHEATVLLLVALAFASALYLLLRGATLSAFCFDAGVMTVLMAAASMAFGILTETRTLVLGVPFFFAFGAGVWRRLQIG